MKLLVVTEMESDFTEVLKSCNVDITILNFREVIKTDVSAYDAYCILGKSLNARIRCTFEAEAEKGKKFFVGAVPSFMDIYPGGSFNTMRSRLIYVKPEEGNGIPGLETGDLLDDESNSANEPCYMYENSVPLLVYKSYIIAHSHTNMSREEIMKDSKLGLWLIGDNIMMASFKLHNFNKARFAPRKAWQKLISYIAEWITGNKPEFMPESIVQYGPKENIENDNDFKKLKDEAIERGIGWLKSFLVENGEYGIKEGLNHSINPEGEQKIAGQIRTDCSGEASGVFKFYAKLHNDKDCRKIAENIDDFVYGPMVVKGGLSDGMMRWTTSAWGVCYQDDVARAILPGLYDCVYLGNDKIFPDICRVLDYLVKTTAKDGLREWRTDRIYLLKEEKLKELAEAEHGTPSAHYNAYYLAALLLAYIYGKKQIYLETAQKGLETLMGMYPETKREQSETEEMCRLVLPLALLYEATNNEEHKAMLYRVVNDLQKHKDVSGGYLEWDTGYKATCSRESKGECSVLTENGDPVVDLLYSTNWLPIGFAYAYHVTKDEWFKNLWKEVIKFCINSQVISNSELTNGSWCRAFDVNLHEAYACPHDAGWATYASESGWTNSEILMGMMMPEILGDNI